MKKIKRSWKPKLIASEVEVRYAAAAVILVLKTRFFEIQMPMSTKMSSTLRNAIETGERYASTIEWKNRHEVACPELIP